MPQRKHNDSPPPQPPSPSTSTSTNNSKTKSKSKFIVIAIVMATLLLVSIILFFALSAAAAYRHHKIMAGNNYEIIHQACKASRNTSTCESSLSKSVSPDATILEVIQSALWVSTQNLNSGQKMVRDILDASAGNQNRSVLAKTCLEILHYSEYRVNLTAVALPRGKIKDARAWVSAALAYEFGCMSGLKNLKDNTSQVVNTAAFFSSSLIPSTSNVLAMMANYDVYGDKTASWGTPKTERDGFWEPGSKPSGSGSVIGVPSGLKADVTVCKGGGCDFEEVQQGVNAAPDNDGSGKRFVIWIKTGVYEETVRIPLEKKNVVFLGDGMGKTVITGSRSVGLHGVTTFDSATVGVLADGFMASGLTMKNTAGADAHQAVAFRSDSDISIIENCEFIGNQDTVYTHSLRQYFKSCRIQGNIDFIFGQAAAVFEGCLILIAPRQVEPEKGENNAVTAHGRIDPGQSTGYVFKDCVINGTDEYMGLYYKNPDVHKNYLGRPWKEYSRTVFINCTMEALISADGWMPWDGDFALKTLYYGEFGNTGPGSDTSKRVSWSSRIPGERIETYSVQNFIQGDQWLDASS